MLLLSLAVLSFALTALGGNYSLCREYAGDKFFDSFYWWKWLDPTHGRVKYVDQKTSRKIGLAYVNPDNGRFVMRVDDKGHGVSINGNPHNLGRQSVRIHSKDLFEDMVLIMKASWMPAGCGCVHTNSTWPAFWTCSRGVWPSGGEIDVVEGVNGFDANRASLHTSPGCMLPPSVNHTQKGYVAGLT